MTRPIRFLLNGKVRELTEVKPTTTVLNLLRYRERLTGTKEGCAEGDCGACTVALAELADGQVKWRAVNVCILFAPMLDGRAVFTVEHLARGGALAAVQEAMVETHGSQCGFCTPGFVMSLWAHQLNGAATDTQTLKDALAGNLCRCTGYGPILAAGQSMGEAERPDISTALASTRSDEALDYTFEGGRFSAPRTLEALTRILAERPDATVMAGGTDVGLWVTKQRRALADVVSLNEIAELQRIEADSASLTIGAGVRYADAHEALAALHPEFREWLRRLGGLQVRNLGTVCGNIANGSPIADMPPALIAAGAKLILRSKAGRRTMPLEDFFLSYGQQDRRPGEFVEAVRVERPAPDRIFRLFKLSKRFDQDISAVAAGISIGVDGGRVSDARLAFGGMAAIPKRARVAEAALTGRPWALETVQAAAAALADDFTPLSDLRASSAYRLEAAGALLVKTFLESQDPGGARLMSLEPVAHG